MDVAFMIVLLQLLVLFVALFINLNGVLVALSALVLELMLSLREEGFGRKN